MKNLKEPGVLISLLLVVFSCLLALRSTTLQGKAFHLTNDEGKVRGGLEIDKDGQPRFFLNDSNGTLSVEISNNLLGNPRVSLYDNEGNERILTTLSGTNSFIAFKRNKDYTVLLEDTEEGAKIRFTNQDQSVRLGIENVPKNEHAPAGCIPGLTFFVGKDLAGYIVLHNDEQGTPALEMHDKRDTEALSLPKPNEKGK